jgi:hypothetical protein
MTNINQSNNTTSNNTHWLIWLLLGLASLLLIVIVLLRGICNDVWYTRWLGIAQNCTTSKISNVNINDGSVTGRKIAESTIGINNLSPELQQFIINAQQTFQQITLQIGIPQQGPQGLTGNAGAVGATGTTGPTGPPGPSDPCTALTTYYCQGGNSFGSTAVFGTNDNHTINTIVNGITQFNTRESGIDINPGAITTFGLAATKLDHTAVNNALDWYTVRINDPANHFENGMYLYNDGTFQAGSFDTVTGFQGNFFSALPGNAISYQPGVYMASYDGSTVQSYAWAAPNSFVIGNTRFDFGPTTFVGAQYAADYSSNYVPLSLITYQDLTGAVSNLCSTDTSNVICQNGNSLGATVTIGTNDANDLSLETAGSVRITINSAGEVGVGGAPVLGKALAVTGDLKVTGIIDPIELQLSGTPINGGGYRITTLDDNPLYLNTSTDRADAVQIRRADNSTVVFDVDTLNQRVGIGTSTPTQKLEVSGDALINGLRTGLGNNAISTNTTFAVSGLSVNSSGDRNTAMGYLALAANTTGSRNTAIGWNALAAVDIGNSNTAVGGNALALTTSGFQNTAIGRGALQAITTAGNNNGFGVLAMGQLQTGTNNVAIGNSAMNVANGGSQNVVIGVLASITQTTAGNNTIIGYNTGGGITTGSNNTIIGANVNGLSSTLANSVIIADGSGNRRIFADSTGNVGIGTVTPGTFRLNITDASTTNVAQFNGSGATQCTVVTGTGWSCTSDEKLKTNILNITNGIDVINQLQGVTYNWKTDPSGSRQDGFIAQDIQKVLPELVTTDSNGNLSLNKDGIMPYIVEAVKQQNGNIDGVNQQLKEYGLQLTDLSDQLRALAATVSQNTANIRQNTDDIDKLKAENKLLEQRLEKLEQQQKP